MEFSFNSKANTEFDFKLVLVASDHLTLAQKDYESIAIPGRSDNLIVDLGLTKNKTITDTCYLVSDNLYLACKEIRTWLMSPLGYQTLSYEDGSSFNAIVKGDIKVKVIFDTAAEITIQYEANEVI